MQTAADGDAVTGTLNNRTVTGENELWCRLAPTQQTLFGGDGGRGCVCATHVLKIG
jgi:hypothetical protein